MRPDGRPRLRVLLDACVLFPTVLREVLLGCAARGLYEPRWSAHILEEWARATVKLGPGAEALARGEVAVAKAQFPAAMGILYRFGPNGAIRMAWVTPGAVLVIILWLAASAAFSLYVANFDSYNEIYGSIGAVVALMMWLYISAYLILLGAALNEVIYGDGTALDHGM